MFYSVFTKTLYDKRGFIAGWCVGVLALLSLTAAFFPMIKESGIEQLFKSIPASMQSIIGDQNDYSSYPGYLGSAVFGLRSEMMFIPLAIILGISLGIKEESSRKLYQLLAQPVSRRSVVFQKWLAAIAVIVAVVVTLYGSIVVTTLLIDEQVPWDLLNKMSVMSVLFLLALFTVTYGLGKAFGRKNLAMLIPIVWVMASFLIDSFGSQIDWLGRFDPVSLLKYYDTSGLVHNPIDLVHVAVLTGVTVFSLLIALLLFPRRDLRDDE